MTLVSETWLKSFHSDKSVDLFFYNLFRNDLLHIGGGGITIYIKSHLPCRVIFLGWLEFMFLDWNHLNLGYLAKFEQTLQEFISRYRHVIVTGDFNIDLKTFLITTFDWCDMKILPLQPTHHTAETWLDIIIITDLTHVAHHGQLSAPGLSKHDLIF